MTVIKKIVRWFLIRLYRVEVSGLEYMQESDGSPGNRGSRLIVANHTSFLDAVLLYAFLPGKATFAVNTMIASAWYMKFLGGIMDLFTLDPVNPMSIRSLIKRVNQGGDVVIFPEGRITVTGALMKVYQGPGLIADKTQAQVLPIRIDGAQYTPFSRLKGRVRLRWFPTISITVLPARQLKVADQYRGRARRVQAGKQLADLMTEMVFKTSRYDVSLFERLLDARKIHGGKHYIAEDIARLPINYNDLVTRSVVLGRALQAQTVIDEPVGVLLPSTLATIATFWGLQYSGRTPALLNYTVGAKGMISSCETAVIKNVITSRRFIQQAKLEDAVTALGERVNLIYLEDLAGKISWYQKLAGALISRSDVLIRQFSAISTSATAPAVILFTSGSEGMPKGVVLSHANLLANMEQLASKVDFNAQDIALNALPLFHSFGLMAGTLLPLLSGIRTFFYPSPLHYRVIPEVAYDINATMMYGTNTFLAGYARFAHPYDFYSIRYVFAGAEKLTREVRRVWEDRFGVRIFEGYGATETSPVIAGNTPMDNRPDTVGRILPGIDYKLTAVPGLQEGARLQVKGPNVMLGYLLDDKPGQLVPPKTEQGPGWYDTGDIVTIDDEGYVRICGRAKRFAKIAGEMVSLTAVEALVTRLWPDAGHAVVAIPDERKGEQLVLLTTQADAERGRLAAQARSEGMAEISVPRKILPVAAIPVLGTGKTDYVTALENVLALAEESL